MKAYILNIIVPSVQKTRHENELPANQKALVIFDVFRGQTCQSTIDILGANDILFVHVPPNCIYRLQPLDISVNKSCKDFIKKEFIDWYSTKILESIDSDQPQHMTSLKLSVMKPLGAKWLMAFQDYISAHPEIVYNGFKAVGIANTLNYNYNL
jgi:hypothetical protein